MDFLWWEQFVGHLLHYRTIEPELEMMMSCIPDVGEGRKAIAKLEL